MKKVLDRKKKMIEEEENNKKKQAHLLQTLNKNKVGLAQESGGNVFDQEHDEDLLF